MLELPTVSLPVTKAGNDPADYKNDADATAKKSKALQKQIDRLVKNSMDEWLGNSKGLIADIKSGNENLQKAINNIKKKVKSTENFVKAVGLIDDAIGIAKGIA